MEPPAGEATIGYTSAEEQLENTWRQNKWMKPFGMSIMVMYF